MAWIASRSARVNGRSRRRRLISTGTSWRGGSPAPTTGRLVDALHADEERAVARPVISLRRGARLEPHPQLELSAPPRRTGSGPHRPRRRPAACAVRRAGTRGACPDGAVPAPSGRRTPRREGTARAPRSPGTGSSASPHTACTEPHPSDHRPSLASLRHHPRSGPDPGAILFAGDRTAAICHASSMARRSAGIVFFRRAESGPEVLLVHPGGPYWARRDAGAWSIPKGEHDPGDGSARLRAARVRGGDGHAAGRGRARRPRRGAPEGRQGGRGLGRRGRPRRRGRAQQHVRAGVAAPLRAPAGVPGGRPRGVVRRRRGAREARRRRRRRSSTACSSTSTAAEQRAPRPHGAIPGVGLEPTRPRGPRLLSPPAVPVRLPGPGPAVRS